MRESIERIKIKAEGRAETEEKKRNRGRDTN